jgi:drug/metabolite transporter (DMT)-like permease
MKVVFSLLSGALAALASVAGKFAFDDVQDPVLRAVSLVSLLLLNAAMLSFFVKALREDGSVVGTSLNMCANVSATSIIGALLFNEAERMTQKWFMGASFVLVGVFCIAKGQNGNKEKVE